MTCTNCEAKVKSRLLTLPDVTSVEVSKDNTTTTISMGKHIAISDFQKALGGADSKYQIVAIHHSETTEQAKSWFQTYKPILLIFFYITFIASVAVYNYHLHLQDWMNLFMALFFLTFSFFKFLDLKGFAESYAMYDVVAIKI